MSQEVVSLFQPLTPEIRASHIARQRTMPRPQQWNVTDFNFEQLFGAMEVIQKGQIGLTYLAHTQVRGLPEREHIETLIHANGAMVNEIIRRIGGIPVRLATENMVGRVTESPGMTNGRWHLQFRPEHTDIESTIYHTTAELRAAHQAVMLPIEQLEA